MSQNLTSAREALSKVPTDIRQGHLISAATAVRDSAQLFIRMPMMRSEHEELADMLSDAMRHLARIEQVTAIFDENLVYQPGAEGALADLMNELIAALQDEGVRSASERREEYKVRKLFEAREEFTGGRLEAGRRILEELGGEYGEDWQLVGEISDLFLSAGLYEEALAHLLRALKVNGGSARILNRLGILLRRLKRFEESNVYFARAVAVEQSDPNLFFNYARLFVDWKKWDSALEYARKALALSPDFTVAVKLAAYAESQSAGAKP